VEGRLIQWPDPQSGGLAHRSVFAEGPVLRPLPIQSVKTTRGVISRIGPLPVHTGLSVQPLARCCLAASRPARPLPDGPHRSWRERPPSPKARYGIVASVLAHPRPSCLGSLPQHQSVPEGCRAPLRGGGGPVGRPAGRGADRHCRPHPSPAGPARRSAFPQGTAYWERPRTGGGDGAVRLNPPRCQSRLAEMGVAPSRVQGARIGIGATLAEAQPQSAQQLARPGLCPAERRFRVRPPPK